MSRMNSKAIALVILCAGFLLGCSSVPISVDKGPIKARTYSFMPAKRADTSASPWQHVHERVQTSITKNLATKGVKRLDRGGEVTVAYLIIVANNAATASATDYFGYGRDAAALADKVHNSQAMKSKNRGYVETGTLVIDFVDPSSSKILWRSSVQSEIFRDMPTEAKEELVQQLVDSALQNLRVSG